MAECTVAGVDAVAYGSARAMSAAVASSEEASRASLGGVVDEENGIWYHRYGISVDSRTLARGALPVLETAAAAEDSSFSLVSASIPFELLQTIERRTRDVYMCGIAAHEVVEVGAALGSGSFGLVRLVEHAPTHRLLALKLIPYDRDPVFRRNVASELRLMCRCHSPVIVELYGAFWDDGRVGLCLEHMTAGSLRDALVAGGAFSEMSTCLVARCMLEALHYLHSKRISTSLTCAAD